MALATLSIDIVAKLAGLEQGVDKANRILAKQAADVERRNASLQASAVALGKVLGSAFAGIGLAVFTKQTIDGLDALNDLRDATGASIENLSGLEDIAARTGTSFETAGAALIKFNKELSDAKPGTETAQIFKALGLSAEELKKIDPAEALTKTAVALAKFADDGNKARIVQALFGKSVGEVAPLLKDLAEKGKLVATATTEQAQAAEAFNKQLFALQKNSTDLARNLVSDLIPAINKLFEKQKNEGFFALFGFDDAFFEAKKGSDLVDKINQLKSRNSKLQNDLNGSIGFFGSPDQIRSEMARNKAELAGYQKQFADYIALRNAVKSAQDPANYGNEGRSFIPPSLPDPSKPEQTDAQKYLENLQKQLQATQNLGVAETVLADIQSRRLKLAAGESAAPLLKIARQIDAAKAAADVAERIKQRIDALPSSKIGELNAQLQALLASRPAAGPGRTDEAIQVLREELEKFNPVAQEAIANDERLKALLDATPSAKLKELNSDFDLLRAKLADTGDKAQYVQAVLARVGLSQETPKAFDQLTVYAEQAARNIQDSLGSNIKDFLSGNYKSIGGLFKNLIVDLTAQAAAAQLGNVLFGDFAKSGNLGGLASKGLDFISTLFNANGNAFDANGRITAFAGGGVFDRPTSFNYGAGQLGVLGEAGPEAVLPLRRGAGGKLGVVAQGGGGGGTVINNISVGAGVTRGEVVALLQSYGSSLKAEILASQRNGGAFAR